MSRFLLSCSLSLLASISAFAGSRITTPEGSERLHSTPLTDILRISDSDTLLVTPDMLGGVYLAYPEEKAAAALVSRPPKGYEPFYISHYGRHGSRYLIADRDYDNIRAMLVKARDADALTPLGLDVLERLDSVMTESRGRGGDLTPLGVRQHKGIARRMFSHYPQVFAGQPRMTARSTIVIRCILSMDAFCEGLKELNTKLDITRESSNRYMDYLNYHSPESNAFTGGDWKIFYRKFEDSRVKAENFAPRIIGDPQYLKRNVDPEALMWGLYWLAADAQDTENRISFYDLFTPEEYYGLWETGNYHNYVADGNSPESNGLVTGNARNLLDNIVEMADEAIASGSNSADFRFGHDGNLMPLAALLQLDGAAPSEADPEKVADVYANYHVSPMAGNVQLIFFRNKGGDVLVKFLLNEQETAIPLETSTFPFYSWKEVKKFYGY